MNRVTFIVNFFSLIIISRQHLLTCDAHMFINSPYHKCNTYVLQVMYDIKYKIVDHCLSSLVVRDTVPVLCSVQYFFQFSSPENHLTRGVLTWYTKGTYEMHSHPQVRQCAFCLVNYTVIAKMEQLIEEDTPYIVKKFSPVFDIVKKTPIRNPSGAKNVR